MWQTFVLATSGQIVVCSTQSVLHQFFQQEFSNRGAELTIEAVVVHPDYIISLYYKPCSIVHKSASKEFICYNDFSIVCTCLRHSGHQLSSDLNNF